MLNFCHTYLYFKDLIRTYFCGIYVYFMRFSSSQKDKFLNPINVDQAVCPLTGPVDRGRSRSTGPVDWRAQNVHAVRTVGRLTVQRALLFENGPGRPAESSALCIQSWSIGPVDRAIDRKGKSALSSCQRADSFGAINTPHLSWFLTSFERAIFPTFTSV